MRNTLFVSRYISRVPRVPHAQGLSSRAVGVPWLSERACTSFALSLSL
jgi:hypothetical protein